MSKSLYISEKPSVAQEFAKALKFNMKKRDGYMESDEAIVTWCVGHLVTMSYPDVYDESLKKWSLTTLPFLPKEFLYEVIPDVSKQFNTVKALLNREDVTTIYVCTDSGREGEYIYRLVDQMAGVPPTKDKRRVWIDSQTEEEILRGIREAKPISAYDHISDAAYLRAKEDYLMGINFSRVLTLKYGQAVTNYLQSKWTSISVGRVMTCVLGMVVRREREIRAFVKTPFYRVIAGVNTFGKEFDGEWKAIEGTKYYNSPLLYKENGFKARESAEGLIRELTTEFDQKGLIEKLEKKKENKNAPLLFNLAELQNECSKLFKISPDETLKVVQELYEKKLVTYPRTDARVLSTAVAKEIHKNIGGLRNYAHVSEFANEILQTGSYKNIAKTRYVNDKQITDHYAIIPTGQGLQALNAVPPTAKKVYETITRRFLSVFYPPAVYQKISLVVKVKEEHFFSNFKILEQQGYLKVTNLSFITKKNATGGTTSGMQGDSSGTLSDGMSGITSGTTLGATTGTTTGTTITATGDDPSSVDSQEDSFDADFINKMKTLKKGMSIDITGFTVKEGETSPPKRYNSGSMILAMENAGQLIEDEELRSQIKGSGIGTSATRAEILNKLVKITYLSLNKKTQIVTPTLLGEMIYDVVNSSIRSLLNAELTASWEKGLTYVAEGSITSEEYMVKLETFVAKMTNGVKNTNNQYALRQFFDEAAKNYK